MNGQSLILWGFLCFVFPVIGKTQTSVLYNSKRQLKADTNYVLSTLEMREWEYLETSFMDIMVKNYEIPLICLENNVSFKGIFEFNYLGNGKFSLVQFHANNFGDREQLLISSFINPNFEEILEQYSEKKAWLIEGIEPKELKFFFPYGFQFVKLKELVDTNGYVMPKVIAVPLIESRNNEKIPR